jgi:hypothetical protein
MRFRQSAFRALLGFGLMLLGSPAMAVAQGPDAVLYEVTEEMKVGRLKGRQKDNTRTATASLMGWVKAGTPICPEAYATVIRGLRGCGLTARATDHISLVTGTGPVTGEFAVVVQDTNKADGPEHVIIRGSISGEMDLSPALFGNTPLGFLRGTWLPTKIDKRGPAVSGGGPLVGHFRLPFVFPPDCFADGDPSDCTAVYLVPGTEGFVPQVFPGLHPLTVSEFSLGDPTVRLELYFRDPDDDDDDDDD